MKLSIWGWPKAETQIENCYSFLMLPMFKQQDIQTCSLQYRFTQRGSREHTSKTWRPRHFGNLHASWGICLDISGKLKNAGGITLHRMCSFFIESLLQTCSMWIWMFINGIFSDGLELLNNPKLIQEGRRGCKSAAIPGYTVIPVGFLKRHAPYRLLMHSLKFIFNADRFDDFHFKEFRGTTCWQHFVFGEYAWARNIVSLKPFALKRNSLHVHGPKPLQTIQTFIFISSHSSNLWDDINNNRSLR